MKKRDFVKDLQNEIEARTGNRPTLPEAAGMLDAFIATLESNLIRGRVIRFRGFGRFEFRKRKGFTRKTYIKNGVKIPEGFITRVDDYVTAYFYPSTTLNKKMTQSLKRYLFDDEDEN